MAISITKGNLLESDSEALVNTVNCVGVMGKGIALQFKRRFPDMYRAYKAACDTGLVRIGYMYIWEVQQLSGPRFVINFPTKQHWKGPSRLEWIERGLPNLVKSIHDLGIRSISIPPLGAGNGGLSWDEVRPLIINALDPLDVEVALYEPTASGSRPVDQLSKLTMSPSRALVLSLMRAYELKRGQLDPWNQARGVSHLEIQKLMYFADKKVPALRLRFERGHFGPYSEVVRHIVQEMEGRYTSGFGDGSARALDLRPIEITEEGERALDQYLASETGQRVAILSTDVLSLTDGFEDAYGLELLASTDMMAADDWVDVEEIARRVRSWNARKGTLFTDSHVATAARHLQEVGA